MSNRTKTKTLLNASPQEQEALLHQPVKLCGWIRTIRQQKKFSFIELNDGSSLKNLQVIVESTLPNYESLLESLTTGASVEVLGEIAKSPGHKQSLEVIAKQVQLIGPCPEEYPLQKKRHSFEFLRTISHLRPRTNTQGAVARVRSTIATATHRFFSERDFLYLHSPLITSLDCEGGGELFRVTTLDPTQTKKTSYEEDFFKREAFLTVSGQLNAEVFASALSDVYTFGPTFRAENSNTSRHLAEFWMIEPEMAFADLEKDKQCAEEFLRFVTKAVLDERAEDMEFFDQYIEPGLLKRLQHLLETPFVHMTYSKAIEVLQKSGHAFTFPCEWGCDLQSEHERYLAEKHCEGPVILSDYPKALKAFYMRDNDDGNTVAAMDIVVPKVGEIIGGSQREERYDILKQKMITHELDLDAYSWYLDLRKYGSVPHAGFGAGFERLVQFMTGIENIRDVNAFPRTPGHNPL